MPRQIQIASDEAGIAKTGIAKHRIAERRTVECYSMQADAVEDAYLDSNAFDGPWQTWVVVVMVATAIYLKRQPNPIKDSIDIHSLAQSGDAYERFSSDACIV